MHSLAPIFDQQTLERHLDRLIAQEAGDYSNGDWLLLAELAQRGVETIQPYREEVLIEHSLLIELRNALRLMVVMLECADGADVEAWASEILLFNCTCPKVVIHQLQWLFEVSEEQSVLRFMPISRTRLTAMLQGIRDLIRQYMEASPKAGKLFPLYQARNTLLEFSVSGLFERTLKPLAVPDLGDKAINHNKDGCLIIVRFFGQGGFECLITLPGMGCSQLGFREFQQLCAAIQLNEIVRLPVPLQVLVDHMGDNHRYFSRPWVPLTGKEILTLRALLDQVKDEPSAIPYWSWVRLSQGHF